MKIGGYLWPRKTVVAAGVLLVVIVVVAVLALRPSSTPSTTGTTTPVLPVTTTPSTTPTTTPTTPASTTPTTTTQPTPTTPQPAITILAQVQVKRCASCAPASLPGDSYVFFVPVGGHGTKTTSYTATGGHVGARLKPGSYRVLVAPPYFTSQRYVVAKLYSPTADPRPTFVAGPKQTG